MSANQLRNETGLCMICMDRSHRTGNYLCSECGAIHGLLGFYDLAARKARMYSWEDNAEGAECWAAVGDLFLELGDT